MAMEAAGEATSAASPLADDVRDAVVADAISRATRTIACQNRARAGSAASRRCLLLRADSVKGESLFVAPLKLLTPITHLFFPLPLQLQRCRGHRWRWRCQCHGAGAVPSLLERPHDGHLCGGGVPSEGTVASRGNEDKPGAADAAAAPSASITAPMAGECSFFTGFLF